MLGEDPNETRGGSGQLPVALTQIRDAQGRYTGRIGFTCHWCRSSEIDVEGVGTVYGTNSLVELGAAFRDLGSGMGGLIPIAANKVRGTGDILLYPAIVAVDTDRFSHFNAGIVDAPSQGTVDFPAWWNNGHRTRRFHDGSFAMDDPRPVMGFDEPPGRPGVWA